MKGERKKIVRFDLLMVQRWLEKRLKGERVQAIKDAALVELEFAADILCIITLNPLDTESGKSHNKNMAQTFERLEKHLYKRQYLTIVGEWTTTYYARFTDWTGKRRIFPPGSDLKTAKEELKILEVRNIRRENLDKDKPIEQKTGAMTFAEWGKKYPYQQGVNIMNGL